MNSNMGKGKYGAEKKDPLKPFYPIIGLIVIVVAGAIGYFAAPSLLTFTKPYLPAEVLARPDNELQLLFAGMIFFVIVAVLGFAFALFAPRPPKEVSDKALIAERNAREMERKRQKKRKSSMRRRMKQGTKDVDDI
jgi:hypothetical protein